MLFQKTSLSNLYTFILPHNLRQGEGIIYFKNHIRSVPPTTVAVDVAAEQRLFTKASGLRVKGFLNCRAAWSGKRRKGAKKKRG